MPKNLVPEIHFYSLCNIGLWRLELNFPVSVVFHLNFLLNTCLLLKENLPLNVHESLNDLKFLVGAVVDRLKPKLKNLSKRTIVVDDVFLVGDEDALVVGLYH